VQYANYSRFVASTDRPRHDMKWTFGLKQFHCRSFIEGWPSCWLH